MQDSIIRSAGYEVDNGIVIPVSTAVQPYPDNAQKTIKTPERRDARPVIKAHHEVPALLAYPFVEHSDSIGGEAAADTIRSIPGETMEGIVLINPGKEYTDGEVHLSKLHWSPMSWVYLAMVALFCVAALKFKGNSRYMKALMTDLTNTRIRPNTFDVTVRETSLLVILNVVWVACSGVLLWNLIQLTTPDTPFGSFSLPDKPWMGILVCAGVAGVYLGLMMLAYWIVGNVFSERGETKLWIKGAAAANGLETFLLFPLAFLATANPAWSRVLLIIAAVVLVFGKIVFLYKGFRIFFVQISSWLLFLYYLCSLEIVPLILTYFAALWACSTWM